jgi:hypothetical protein
MDTPIISTPSNRSFTFLSFIILLLLKSKAWLS